MLSVSATDIGGDIPNRFCWYKHATGERQAFDPRQYYRPIDNQRMLTMNNCLGQSLEHFKGNFFKIHNNTTENEWHRSFLVQ